MAHAPFLAAVIAEQLTAGHIEQAPVHHPLDCLILAVRLQTHEARLHHLQPGGAIPVNYVAIFTVV